MAISIPYVTPQTILLTILLSFLPIATPAVPSDRGQLEGWFHKNIGPFESRKATLLPEVVAAETNRKVITVQADSRGQFRTITDAIKSIPDGNKNRIIVLIGPGTYTEKVSISHLKPFITLYGDPTSMPTLVYNATARSTHGTVNSATLDVEADHFSAVNMNIRNSAPQPSAVSIDAQALAMRINGDYASFYNCKFYGFQDTLLDDRGKHFYKDCYIEGTVDFIFGRGQTLFLGTELHVLGNGVKFITAQQRNKPDEPGGYVFAQCKVTGTGKETTYLGRPLYDYARVIYAYCSLSNVINPLGWNNNKKYTDKASHAYFAEYKNKGDGARLHERVAFAKKLSPRDVEKFVHLSYIEARKWLLPPTRVRPSFYEFDTNYDDDYYY